MDSAVGVSGLARQSAPAYTTRAVAKPSHVTGSKSGEVDR